MPSKNAFYAQSGGVTAVINASACGVIETARKHRNRIGKVYAGRNGTSSWPASPKGACGPPSFYFNKSFAIWAAASAVIPKWA